MLHFPPSWGASLGIGGGASLLAWTLAEARRGLQSRAWPRTTGTVIGAQVVERRSAGSSYLYRVAVTYRYVVAGHAYEGTRRSFGGEFLDDRPSAERELRAFASGTCVGVYYDPNAPSDAVLDPGLGAWPPFGILLSLGLIAYGFWAF